MIIHSPIISGSLTFADGATVTYPDGGSYSGSFSGSLQVSEVQSHIIPDTANTYDLGSATNYFRDLYISTGSLKGMGNGTVAFKLSGKSGGGLKVTDDNDDEVEIVAKEITLKDTSGNGRNIKLKVQNGALKSTKVDNSDVEDEDDEAQSASSNISGSLIVTGSSTLGVINASGLISADAGLDVDGVFTVADSTGNVATTGTLSAGNTDVATLDASGLASLDGGVDVDGAFTVADGTGNVSTTGTLSAGATTLTSTVDVTGLASLDGGVDVDGAFTVANTSGNVSTSGTLGVSGTSTLGVVNASGLISADAGLDVDGAFTVADSTGNVSTSGTLNVTGLTTVGIISGSNGDFTGNLSVGGDLTVAGAMTNDGHIIPAEHNTYDLGSTTKFWRDLYLSSGSLYINGIQVLSTDGTDLTFQTDEGESTKILETANDTITLESVNGDITLVATGTGNIELDAPVQITAGKNILSSDGNAIAFANDVSLGSNNIFAANLSGVVSSSAITYTGDNIDVAGNTTIQGNLTVQGTQTILNTATLNIEDKNLLIASGAADSAAANGGGITIDGADATITWVSADSNIAFNTDVNIPTDGLKLNGTAVTSTAAELNLLDGVSGLVQGDFTKLAAVDTTATELNVLNGIPATLTATELGYVDGVTSAIQTQIDSLSGSLAGNVSGSASFLPIYDSNGTAFENSIVSQSAYGEGDTQLVIGGSRTVINQEVISTTYSSPSGDALRLGGIGNTEEIRINGADIESATDTTKKILVVGTSGQIHTADGDEDVSFASVDVTDTTASTTSTTGAVTVAGGVGIAGALNVGGDVVAYASSDERLKDNIQNIENPIEKVQSLKGVTWDWNDNADELQQSLPNVGVIAQDVEKVLPQLVTDRDNGFKGVDYAKLTGLLIEAIKDQQSQIDELKSKLS